MTPSSKILESLESRRLLSASVEGGNLVIDGTSAADEITISFNDARTRIIVEMNGETESFARADFNRVYVWAKGGADTLVDETDGNVDDGDPRVKLVGGPGDDHLTGGTASQLLGNSGDDTILADGGIPLALGRMVPHRGGIGNDTFTAIGDRGTSFFGEGGRDTMTGGAGNDTLTGDSGSDSVIGGEGDDFLGGGSAADFLDAGNGNNRINSNWGDDEIIAGDGNDEIWGEKGNDTITAGAGNDRIKAGDGDDLVHGNAGNDTLRGGDDADTLFGDEDDDTLRGEAGTDQLDGGAGTNTVTQ